MKVVKITAFLILTHAVRKGPYSPAVLRFQVSFPSNYSTLPPSINFISDIFHPLVTPLTTYTYTTGSLSSDTVSATDEERLPPGGFSLRHGFPHWFGRAEKSATSSITSSRNVSDSYDTPASTYPRTNMPSGSASPISQTPNLQNTPLLQHVNANTTSSILDILYYMKRTFDDGTTLDALPLEAAGNPGAWNAWRAHRRIMLQNTNLDTNMLPLSNKSLTSQQKQQDQWSWEGVWEERVRKGIDASISDAALYGNAGGGDDLVCSR